MESKVGKVMFFSSTTFIGLISGDESTHRWEIDRLVTFGLTSNQCVASIPKAYMGSKAKNDLCQKIISFTNRAHPQLQQ